MSDRKPFRQIRETTKLAQAAVNLLMGLPNVKWDDREYSLFYMMTTIQGGLQNPSYRRVLTLCGAWLRFLKKLIDRLANDELRSKWQDQFTKLSAGYEELLVERQNHDKT